MFTNTNVGVGVVVKIIGYATAKSDVAERALKVGDIIYQNDKIITQGEVVFLMVDGTMADIKGEMPFEAGNYLLTEDGHPTHASPELIQHAVMHGADPQQISEAILSCIPLDKQVMPDEHGPAPYMVGWGQEGHIDSGFSTTVLPGGFASNAIPGSEFPIVVPAVAATTEVIVIPPLPPAEPVLIDTKSLVIHGEGTRYVSSETINVGNTVEFQFTVSNPTTSNFTGPITITDSNYLPADFQYSNPNATAGSFDLSTGVWTISGGLAAGATDTLTFDATALVSSAGGSFTDILVSSTPVSNEPPSVTVDINPAADLSVIKDDGKTSAVPGTMDTYTITVSNNGPSTVTSVDLVDNIPAALLNPEFNPNIGNYDAATGIWSGFTLASGHSITMTLTGEIDPNATGNLVNTVTVSPPSGVTDPNLGNNNSSDTDTLTQQADLAIQKTVDHATPFDGNNVIFTINVENNGPSNATGVNVHDILPAGLTFVSDTASAGSYNSGTGVWTIGNLANGGTDTLTITAKVNDPSLATETNTATISGNQTDPNTNNNSASASVNPVADADLSITKIVNNATPFDGNNVIFTITAMNNGPDAATGVNVHDILPAGLTFVSDTASAGSYNSGTGVWTIGNLANGGTDTLTITAKVNDPSLATETNTATISGNQTDPNTNNNSASASVNPVADCDLSITKSVSDTTPHIGESLLYTLKVSNTGPDAAANVVVTDALPAGLVNVSNISNGGVFNAGTDTITWNLGNLAVGNINLTFNTTVATFAFEKGDINPASVGQEMTAWNNGAGLYAYTLGTAFTDAGKIDALSLSHANGTVTYANPPSATDAGVGVSGGSSPDAEIDYNSNTGQTEGLVVDLGASHANTHSATITVSSLGGGEMGEVIAYNSAGVQVGGPYLFQGTSGSGNNIDTLTISPGPDFEYLAFTAIPSTSDGTSSYYVEDIKYLPDTLSNQADVVSTTAGTNTATSNIVNVAVTGPVAGTGTVNSNAGTESNVMFTMDVSGSMANNAGLYEPKIDFEIQSIQNLLIAYGKLGLVEAQAVSFSNTASILESSWSSVAQIIDDINKLSSGGNTNYDAALGLNPDGTGNHYTTGAQQAYVESGKLTGAPGVALQNVNYFTTDGGPNEPSGSAGINPNTPGNTGEETQWQNFLSTNNITSYAIAMGLNLSDSAASSSGSNNDTVGQELNPIGTNTADNDNTNTTPVDVFGVSNLSNLPSVLNSTVATISGHNLLTDTNSSFGTAGAGHIQSIAMVGDGAIFNFNGSVITENGTQNNGGTFSFASDILTINDSSTLGTLAINMDTGAYTYTAPTNAANSDDLSVPILFALDDAAGNIANGDLLINVNYISQGVISGSAPNEVLTGLTDGASHVLTVGSSTNFGSIVDANSGQDTLVAGNNNGFLLDASGSTGNDLLIAGPGNNQVLTGATHTGVADTFEFNRANDGNLSATINNFQAGTSSQAGSSVLNLSDLLTGELPGNAGQVLTNASQLNGEVTVSVSGGNTIFSITALTPTASSPTTVHETITLHGVNLFTAYGVSGTPSQESTAVLNHMLSTHQLMVHG